MAQQPSVKIIFYELNEAPWQVIDYFIKECPTSTFAKILQHAHQYTTETKDSGELHPWSTWPTVHRGVYNDTHGIRFLNQKIKNDYPPLWQILTESKKSVGLFGSLQSYPIPKNIDYYRFYVPDTFAPTYQTHPKSLEPFQRFNLSRTKKDGGHTPEKIKFSLKFIKEVLNFFELGLSLKTGLSLGAQLIKEKLNPSYKHIRSIFQAPVTFDFYYRLLEETHPDFSSYFTNHLAGMMHRYWKYAFPTEFNYTLEGDEDHFKAHTILKAMEIADRQLSKLKEFADTHGYTLMIGSSMGQEAVDRGAYKGELRITDVSQFYQGLGYLGPVKNDLAMQPDFVFSFDTEESKSHFKALVSLLTDSQGTPLFTLKEDKLTLNCNLKASDETLEKQVIYKGTLALPLEHFGLSLIERDPGTGYHQPKGIWIIYKKGIKPVPYREKIESVQIAPTILSLFGLKKPSYMKKGLDLDIQEFATYPEAPEPDYGSL